MRCGMKKPRALTVRRYVARLNDPNKYLTSFPGVAFTDNIGVIDLSKILLKKMHTRWSRHAYVQGFDCEYINFKRDVICLSVWKSLSPFMKVW